MTTKPFRSPGGIQMVVEHNPVLPLVDLEIAFPTGAASDPKSKTGRTRMMTRLIRSGIRGMTANETDDAFARLGARFSVETSMSSVRVRASVIDRNLTELLALLGQVISRPAFRKSDVERARRETLADLASLSDNDSALASRVFRELVFGDHVYARSIVGSVAAVTALSSQDLAERYKQVFRSGQMIVGFSGPRSNEEFAALADRFLGDLTKGKTRARELESAKGISGRHIVVVDKPDRSQVQVIIGGLGSYFGDPKRDALSVANVAFGGLFTSPLVQEVRERRGWSYSVGSSVGSDRCREAWSMWSHPSLDQSLGCIALQLRLLERWVSRGVTQKQFRATQRYLINSHCFDVDTAGKRMDSRVDELVYGLPVGSAFRFPERVRAVSREKANQAVRARIDEKKIAIVVVGDASVLRNGLARIPGVRSLSSIPYRDVFSGSSTPTSLAGW